MRRHRLQIELVKQRDGCVVLRGERDDGSAFWQKQEAKYAAFFPLHDLTHYAVETELGVADAFFGLIASGWSIEDTNGKSARGPLPLNALFVEAVVGTLDAERASPERWTAVEFNESLATLFARTGRHVPRQLTDDELTRIRRRRAELFEAWRTLDLGSALALHFPPHAVSGALSR